ncbi:hypothetical protein M885DRAFT_287982 [Pelagophyceae sp. CCMP2097]|nr:hypothetical protein M885DRAFT_287982 [Pelagophyceae sp. CCMP2097]
MERAPCFSLSTRHEQAHAQRRVLLSGLPRRQRRPQPSLRRRRAAPRGRRGVFDGALVASSFTCVESLPLARRSSCPPFAGAWPPPTSSTPFPRAPAVLPRSSSCRPIRVLWGFVGGLWRVFRGISGYFSKPR